MPPIHTGNGTGVIPKGFTEVRKGDGTVLYSAGTTQPSSGVSRWTFDSADTSSSTSTDVWGDNDGSINGATTGVTGANQTYSTNEAYSFAGDDYVVAPSAAGDELNPSDQLSLAAWVKFDDYSTAYEIVSKWYDGTEAPYRIFYSSTDDAVIARLDGTGADVKPTISSYSSSVSTGEWAHIVVTYDGSTAKIYLNGTEEDSISNSFTFGQNDIDFYIGVQDNNGTFDSYLSGDVDDVRFYSKGLSGTEVTNLYNNGDINDSSSTTSLTVNSTFSNYDTSSQKQRNMDVDGASETLYFVTDDFLHAWDISSPTSPSELDTFGLTHGCGIRITDDGSTAYVADGWYNGTSSNDEIQVVDISDPSAMTSIATLKDSSLWATHGMALSPDENTLVAAVYGSDNLATIDVSTPSSPTIADTITMGGAHDAAIGPNNNYAFVAAHDGFNNSDPPAVYAVDISDPTNISVTSSIEYSLSAAGARLSKNDDYLFTGTGSNLNLITIDVTDPTSITEVNRIDAADPYRIRVDGDDLYYAASYSNGEQLVGWFDVTDPTNPVRQGDAGDFSLEVEKHPNADVLYSANEVDGVPIIEINR